MFDSSEKETNEQSAVSIGEIGERLCKLVPGVVVMDNDFTLKTKEYELGMGGKVPGRLPEESVKLLRNLVDKGWQVLVVSNQPREGHQVARTIKLISGKNYPIFPDNVVEILGQDGVAGGGKDFLWKRYKETPEAVSRTVEWIKDHLDDVLGQVYFVGDRQSDIGFGLRVSEELKKRGVERQTNIWKVRGLDLPKPLKPLERFIP